MRLASVKLDRYAYSDAARHLEQALQLNYNQPEILLRLAHCYNCLGSYVAAIELLKNRGTPCYERAAAYLGTGERKNAKAELHRLLDAEPQHVHGAWKLLKILRQDGRIDELLATCEDLFARGARHSQLFYDWGRALALQGDFRRARALLFTNDRIANRLLPVPDAFDDIGGFNDALAEELLTNPAILSAFPPDEANRGSSRVHNLLSGRRPELIRSILRMLEAQIETYLATVQPIGDFDPWFESMPGSAHLRAWGLIQKGTAYEEWHLHRGGGSAVCITYASQRASLSSGRVPAASNLAHLPSSPHSLRNWSRYGGTPLRKERCYLHRHIILTEPYPRARMNIESASRSTWFLMIGASGVHCDKGISC